MLSSYEKMHNGQHDVAHAEDAELTDYERAEMQKYGVKSILYIPLRIREQLIGYAELWETRQHRDFADEEIELCQDLAQQAAVALENARTYEISQREIAERKQAEQALQQERNRAEKYLDIAGVMFVTLNVKGEITLVNRKGSEILGHRQEEIIGKNWFDSFLPVTIKDQTRAIFEGLMAGEVEPAESFENPVVTKGGEERIIAWHNIVLVDDEGNIIGTLSSGEDITERKQAEEKLRESEERLHNLYDRVEDMIYEADFSGRIIGISPSIEKHSGYRPEELIGRKAREFYPYPDEYAALLSAMQAEGAVNDFEIHLEKKNGELAIISVTAHIVFDEDGQPVKTEGIMRDITARVRAKDALRDSEERYRALFNSVPVGIYRSTPEGRFLDGNPALLSILGYPDQETLLAADIRDLYLDESAREQELALVEQDGIVNNHRIQLRRYDGAVIWVQDSITIVSDNSGQTEYYYGRLEDITERVWTEMELQRANKQLNKQLTEIRELEVALREQAIRDPLTGVFNRRYMDEVLQQELTRAARKEGALSVVILDLDYLKEINDTYGHVTGGDKALQTLADTLKQMCREEDTLCRYGGDEFLVILYDTPAQVAYERASQWQETVGKIKITSDDREFGITFSAGVAAFPAHGSTGEGILQNADRALYRAKELGRDQVVVYQKWSSI